MCALAERSLFVLTSFVRRDISFGFSQLFIDLSLQMLLPLVQNQELLAKGDDRVPGRLSWVRGRSP